LQAIHIASGANTANRSSRWPSCIVRNAIRAALGASIGTIVRLIMRTGLISVAIGCVTGVILSVVGSRLMRGLLFEVSSTDAISFGAAAFVLIVVAAVACYLPARRAAAVDPASTLQA
jgi:putative ABC transport system permease protein